MAPELVELAEGDRGEDVGEIRLVAGHGDVVERAVPAPHDAEIVDRGRDVVAVGRDDPALARGDVLRRVEREARDIGERADLAAAVLALDRVRGVLHDRQPERPQRVEIGRLAREVHGQDGLRPRPHERRDVLRIDVEVRRADVCEDRRRARVDDDVGRRGPRDRRRDDLVTGADAQREQREVHRRRARGDGERVLRAHVLGETALQLGRVGPRRQPARAEGLGHRGDLLLTDRRRLEAEEGLPRRSRRGSGSQQRESVRVSRPAYRVPPPACGSRRRPAQPPRDRTPGAAAGTRRPAPDTRAPTRRRPTPSARSTPSTAPTVPSGETRNRTHAPPTASRGTKTRQPGSRRRKRPRSRAR